MRRRVFLSCDKLLHRWEIQFVSSSEKERTIGRLKTICLEMLGLFFLKCQWRRRRRRRRFFRFPCDKCIDGKLNLFTSTIEKKQS